MVKCVVIQQKDFQTRPVCFLNVGMPLRGKCNSNKIIYGALLFKEIKGLSCAVYEWSLIKFVF